MSNPNDMVRAIASRSFEDSGGSLMRRSLKQESEKHEVSELQQLNESAEGRRFVESVRGAKARLSKLLANAPAGTIATRIRRDLESIRDSISV